MTADNDVMKAGYRFNGDGLLKQGDPTMWFVRKQ
jgi:hypothetical protein